MDNERDCIALLCLLEGRSFPSTEKWNASEIKQAALGLIWSDLAGRLTRSQISFKDPSLETLRARLFGEPRPESRRSNAERSTGVEPEQKHLRQVDVLVICPLVKELYPVLAAFGINPFRQEGEDENLDGCQIYYSELQRDRGDRVSLAIAAVTKPRNVPAAIATLKFIVKFNPEAVILAGIGGGVKTKVNLGDVVTSQGVIDIEGGRSEPGGVRPRDEPITPPDLIEKQIAFFNVNPVARKAWVESIRGELRKIRESRLFLLPTEQEMDREFKIEPGIIVTGEKLRADGTLPQYLERDDRIRSCDMEGSGFGQACKDRDKQWVVFRGISDFGEDPKPDLWQSTAALNCALAVVQFLRSGFRLRREITKF